MIWCVPRHPPPQPQLIFFNIFVSFYFCVKVLVAQSGSTLWDPMDYSPPGSTVHGILQARILEQVTISYSRGPSWSRIEPVSPELAGEFFTAAPPSSNSKEPACNVGDLGSIPRSRRSPGEGNGYPLQYSCLENSMNRGAWWVTVYGVTKSQTRLRTHTDTHELQNNMAPGLLQKPNGGHVDRNDVNLALTWVCQA